MDRFFEISTVRLSRAERRARRRRYRADRRAWLPRVRRIVLHDTRPGRPSHLLQGAATATLWELAIFLDCCPHLRYVVTLERRTDRGPQVLVDTRGTAARLDLMVGRVLGEPAALPHVGRWTRSDRSVRRRDRIVAAVDALVDRLHERDDLQFLLLWHVLGGGEVELDSSAGWSPEARLETLRHYRERRYSGLLLPPGEAPGLRHQLGRSA